VSNFLITVSRASASASALPNPPVRQSRFRLPRQPYPRKRASVRNKAMASSSRLDRVQINPVGLGRWMMLPWCAGNMVSGSPSGAGSHRLQHCLRRARSEAAGEAQKIAVWIQHDKLSPAKIDIVGAVPFIFDRQENLRS
jgi:hypothetical protein